MIRSKHNSLNQKTQDQFDVFENLLTYPSSITILAEIMIRGQVSVKQLLQLEFIDLKKTIIYQRLADFENYQFIYTKKEQQIIQGKSGPRKATHKLYSLNNEIFEPMLVNLFKTRPRDAKLFGYYLQNAFIQREIRKLERMTNDEARDLFENKDFRFEAQKDGTEKKVRRYRPIMVEPIYTPEVFALVKRKFQELYAEYLRLSSIDQTRDPVSLFSSDRQIQGVFIATLLHFNTEFDKRMKEDSI